MSVEILIVDDNSDIRNILNDLIEDAGYKTRLAANYNQALNEIDKKMPDVAILDVKLDKGDSDGIQLLTHIKSKNNDVPVISGTTGWLDKYNDAVSLCEKNKGAFIYASNFSLGVNIFFELNEILAKMMTKLDDYKVDIEEIHHTQK